MSGERGGGGGRGEQGAGLGGSGKDLQAGAEGAGGSGLRVAGQGLLQGGLGLAGRIRTPLGLLWPLQPRDSWRGVPAWTTLEGRAAEVAMRKTQGF